MSTLAKELKDKILLFPVGIPRKLQPKCELRVPGLPVVTIVIDVQTDGSVVRFDIPETEIAQDVGWIDFKDGEAGQLVKEENFGEALGRDSEKKVFLSKCLVQGRTWHQQPVKAISASGVTAHELQISPIKSPKGGAIFESYILSGFDLAHWIDVTDLDDGDGSFTCANDRIGLGKWTLRKIDERFVRAVFFEGSQAGFCSFQELTDILPLISFINGRRVYIVKKELFSQDGEIVNETYLRNLSPSDLPKQCQPIPLRPDHESQLLYELPHIFDKLIPTYTDWKKKIFIDEAIFHLHSALASALESKFAILSICFETLASSYSRHKCGNQVEASKYLETNEFNREMKPILDLFSNAFRSRLTEEEFESMRGKLLGVNNRAMSNRFKMILDDVGLVLNKKEKEILSKRNPAIHDGVLVRQRDKIDWQEIIGYEGILLTIVNRMILRLLGYKDKVIDYGVVGHPEREV
jgi:hypothetical protein